MGNTRPGSPPLQPDWYRDAIIYEVNVRTFFDGNGDGVGDFEGLTAKLCYLKDLGVTALWLLPFYPSPLKDGGYDISDYMGVLPGCGTLDSFDRFLGASHDLGIRIITELVLNHTSDQHPWFQRSRRADPGSKWRDFYVWSDTTAKYGEARVIFRDFEKSNWTWDPLAQAYYWHRFFSHQPDLNHDSQYVRTEITKAVDFWLSRGVDGFRLDAAPFLFEREGTSCENLPETHQYLKALRSHIDSKFPGRVLLVEANQPAKQVASYFGSGDECHMAFHFNLALGLFKAVQSEDSAPIVEALRGTTRLPDSCQWAIFLRNHDELSLEQVGAKERAELFRAFARDLDTRVNLGIRRRLAPLLSNDRSKLELLNVLLFSLPGTPVIYYGDEVGMGDDCSLPDRDGIRTPMQWNGGPNGGFSGSDSGKLYPPPISDGLYGFKAVNVAAQLHDSSSLLAWMKRLIRASSGSAALRRGKFVLVPSNNRKILSFIRANGDEEVLVSVNLSGAAQEAILGLGGFRGSRPRDLLSEAALPRLGPSTLELGFRPYGYHLLSLEGGPGRGRRSASQTTKGIREVS
ncbi:MAG TPA: maltose alpha-D-glucosyltransferase [Conexivisphaerales archaeon]|nr:maltose alpha-D-glucosyltransferase [Conexivisphaerales archaeon]